jgi:hypothetical protein
MSLSNLPDPGKVEFVVDGHAAFGNPTDPILGRRWPNTDAQSADFSSTAIREYQS